MTLPNLGKCAHLYREKIARVRFGIRCVRNVPSPVAGATGFVTGPYWSSSELSATDARSRVNQQGGDQGGGAKSSTALVRPIRAF
jgi:hypothetical protein